MKVKLLNEHFNSILTVIFCVLTLGAAKALDYIAIKDFWPFILIVVVFIILIVFIVNFLTTFYINNTFKELQKDIREDIKRSTIFNLAIADNLVDVDKLLEIEKEQKCKDIWVLTHNLSNDTDNGSFVNVVRHNIRRKVVYTYIVPDTPSIRGKLNSIESIFQDEQAMDLLHVYLVPEDKLRNATYTGIVIFNPTRKLSETPPVAYEHLAISNSEIKICIKLSEFATHDIIGHTASLISQIKLYEFA